MRTRLVVASLALLALTAGCKKKERQSDRRPAQAHGGLDESGQSKQR